MSDLFVKPKGVRYVDMAIWIDENIHKDSFDEAKAFEYMYLLARMLAYKSRYFRDPTDYDGFACFLACAVYSRLTDRNKGPIKSVLNYMKSIKYFRKVAYEKEAYAEIIDPVYVKTWDSDAYREKNIRSLESENKSLIANDSIDLLKEMPKYIHESMPKIYKNIYHNLYMSVALSMLNKFTLRQNFDSKLKDNIDNPSFNIVSFYSNHFEDKIILWRLDDSYTDLVRMVINKVNKKMSDGIKDIVDDYHISDKQFNDMSIDNILEMHNESN